MNPVGKGLIDTEAMQQVPSCWLQAESSLEALAKQVQKEQPDYGQR